MEKTPGGWTVIDREAGVLALDYTFTKGGHSTTFAARMGNGQMLVVSPACRLSDVAAAELLEFGEVGALMANNGWHHLGIPEWRERFPNARVFAPEKAGARIKKKNAEAGELEPLEGLQALLGDGLGFRDVPNSKIGESWVWAKISGGYAWYMSDVLANKAELPTAFFPRMMFKLTKSAPGYKVFSLAMMVMVKDKKGTLRLLLEDVKANPPTVVVPAHGELLAQPTIAADTQALLEAAL